jgi:D-alanyl-D-alanine carboxypeptidase
LPYGDGGTAEDRTTTAVDLARLAAHALGHDLFRQIVGTAEYTSAVTTADGGSRQAKWQNPNQSLGLGEVMMA